MSLKAGPSIIDLRALTVNLLHLIFNHFTQFANNIAIAVLFYYNYLLL